MHGNQWSYDDLRNAERMAKIQAEALVKAQRQERERQERLAAHQETHTQSYSASPEIDKSNITPSGIQYSSLAECCADRALSYRYGSRRYLFWRYFGLKSGVSAGSMAEKLAQDRGWTIDRAWEYLVSTYNESDWKQYECRDIEFWLEILRKCRKR